MTDLEIQIAENELNERRMKFKVTKKYSDEVYYKGQRNLIMRLGYRLVEMECGKVILEKK